jgi:hypothetical protein
MSKFLLIFVLLGTAVDDYCREKYGHAGDLGVTSAAVQHFTPKTTYHEAMATIGAVGQEVSNKQNGRKTYRWQDGQLEMEFRGDRLVSYRFNDRLMVFGTSPDASGQYRKIVDDIREKNAKLEDDHRKQNQAAILKNQAGEAAFERSIRGAKRGDEARYRKTRALQGLTAAREAQEKGNLQIADQLLQFAAKQAERIADLTGDEELAKQILEARVELSKEKSQR